MAFSVPLRELEFRVSRAGGPGGQHVNKASTRVEVLWDLASPALTAAERERLTRKLANRIDAAGVLHVTADERRSQLRNREAAIGRLSALVAAALSIPKPRKKTRPSRAAKEARLRAKKVRGGHKRERRHKDWDE